MLHMRRDMRYVTHVGGGLSQNVSYLALLVRERQSSTDWEENNDSVAQLSTQVIVEKLWLHSI